MPPVGINRTIGNGPRQGLQGGHAPHGFGRKELTMSTPWSRAIWTSVAVATPGKTGTAASWASCTTSRLNPGVTMNLAPAPTASSSCLA